MDFMQSKKSRGRETRLIFLAGLLAVAMMNSGCLGLTGANNTNGAQDTVGPTVAITSPTSGANVSGTVSVVATASDDSGVARVQFRADNANMGSEDVVPPFAISWNTSGLAQGNHTLVAVARDGAGNLSTSAPVVVSLAGTDSTPPTVSITSPGNNASVSGTINIQVSASDNVGVAGVQFKVDGANTGAEDTVSPYSYSLNTVGLSNGIHSLTAVARDAANNTATSAAVSINANNVAPDTAAPSVSISAPVAGATISGTVSISATASDNVGVVGVQFKVDGANVGAEDTAAPYSSSWNTVSVSNGSHSVTAVARDAAGNTRTSAAVNVTANNVAPDTTAPTVSISSPASGATVSGSVSLSASASDNVGVVGVQFRVDGANLGAEDTTSAYSASWDTRTASNGSHSISAVARDAAGNTRTSTAISVTVNNVASDTTAPTVSISAPAAGASVSGSVSLSASASDNVGVAGVQFKVDGANIGAEDSTSPYSVSWDTLTSSNGSHSITAVARDATGNSRTSTAVSVTINNASSTGRVITISPSNADATCNEEFENVANTLQPGDTLILRGGTYTQNCRRAITANGTAANPITIRAATGETPVLTRPANNIDTQNNIEIVSSSYLIIKGIQFKGGSSGVRFVNTNNFITIEDCEVHETGNNAIAVNSGNSDGLIIRRNHIHHTGLSSGSTEGEGMYLGCNNNTCRVMNSLIESNYIHHTRGTSSGGNDGIEVKVGSGGNTVRNNVIHDTNIGQQFPAIFVYGNVTQPNIVEGNVMWNCGECIQVEADAVIRNNIILNHSITGIAVIPHAQVPTMRNVTIVNNTIYGGPECVVLSWSSASNMTFANNAVYCPSGTAVSGSGLTRTGITIRNNYVTGALSGGSVDNSTFFNGGSATSAFVNPAGMNLWPAVGSVLRGTANSSFAPSNDFNGTTRTSPYDVGAYETEGLSTNPGWTIQPGFKSGTAPSTGDTTPPTVSITSPANGQTISGTISVSATALDNTGVGGVQFKIDGANLNAEDTSSPYSVTLDTATLVNGSHQLQAVARDAAGNASTASISITVNNGITPSPVSVSISPQQVSVQAGGTVQFSATVLNAQNTSVTWSATAGTVSSAGFYTAPATAGSAQVTATSVADPTKSATAQVTITSTPPPSGTCAGSTDASATIMPDATVPARPALGAEIRDPKLGGCYRRFSDSTASGAQEATHIYSEMQAWNADGTKVLLEYAGVMDAQTGARIAPPPPGISERWSPTDPNVIFYLDSGSNGDGSGCGSARLMKYVLSGSSTQHQLVRCFTEYSSFDKDRSWQEMSAEGNRIALISSSGQAFVYDIVAQQKMAVVSVGLGIEWVQVSPSGRYLLVNYGGNGESRGSGLESFDPATGAYLGKVNTGHGHGSTAWAQDGTEWYVADYAANSGTGVTGPYVVKSRLPRGHDDWKAGDRSGEVALVDHQWGRSMHVSCLSRTEWCAVSTYASSGAGAFYNEVFRVSLNGTDANPEVERLVHHYSDYSWQNSSSTCNLNGYRAQPHASISRDGSQIIFGSSWGQVCRTEAYVIRLAGSPAPPPTPSAPTVAITSPTSGASVSGTVSLTASATSSLGVAGVQFKVDGVNVGAEDTTAPYSISLSTTTLSNGSHTVTAVVRDSAGNTLTSGSVIINVNNTTSDTAAPVISGILASPNVSSAIISWATNEAADSQVEFGPTTAYGQSSPLDTTRVTGHSVTLSGLLSSTTHHYRVKSRDAAGNLSVSADQSFVTLNQTTSGIPSSLGWYQIPNTRQGDHCPPDAFGYSFSSRCSSVIGAWGGGIADTARNRMIVWGGGHGDYAGNELYAMEFSTLTMKRLNSPSPPPSGSPAATSDGKPNSRHTYNGLAYVAHLDKMFAFSGSLWSSGEARNDTWLLDLDTLQWRQVSATGPSADYNVHAHYDSVTKQVFVADRGSLWRFDPASEQYTRVGSLGLGLATSSVIDPKRRILFVFGTDWGGSRQFSAVNVDTGQPVSMTLSGCDGLISSAPVGNGEGSGPGLDYDPVQDKIIGWVTGDTIYVFDPDARSCTTRTFAGGPGTPNGSGTYGRFRYYPSLGVFGLVNKSGQNAYTLRLTSPQASAQATEVIISGIAAINITATSVTVVWMTSAWADGQIACGVFAPEGIRSALDLTPAINHAHTLNFLDPDTTYQCRAISRDSAGQLAVSPVFSFRTAK